MALLTNDLNFNEDLTASELTTIKGGHVFTNAFTSAFGRDANANTFAGAFAERLPGGGRGSSDAHADVQTLSPSGVGLSVAFAVALVTPDQQDIRARFFS